MNKKGKFTLQRYRYNGWHSDTAKPGEILFMDTKYLHPDPLGKMLWGRRSDGNMSHGDFKGFFEKVGRSKTFEYEIKGRTAFEEKVSRMEAVRKAIREWGV